ncbi:ATPase, T2SS/T4P/T4SS family [Aliikangiella sp. IMCC44359]|uniref:ATPase, T2SS/T4P/T4SS family n=1 Tax=Aliikangiella sp. IMCC44359 TaxID=3459125 RepID=UPI00403AAFCA
MDGKSINEHWLLSAARFKFSEQKIPEKLHVADNLSEAWLQVSSIFNISEMELADAVAQYSGLALVDKTLIDSNARSFIREKQCRELNILPVREEGNQLIIALSDPSNINELERQLKFSTGRQVVFEIMPPDEIDTYLISLYSRINDTDSNQRNTINLSEDFVNQNSDTGTQTVRLAKVILSTAIDKSASDIHIQPFAGGGIIRFRVDGVLVRIATIPGNTLGNLSRYFKNHSGMDSAKDMIAQDGRIRLVYEGKDYDVRMSILPSHGGERIVARILNQNRVFSLANSGFSLVEQHALQRMVSYPAGIVLLTGPTGSGKTSTLYALLSDLNRVDINIITIEEPVEYVLPGTSQVNVNNKQGLGFAESLRSILRQDPDVILVGEIRDAETAQIAAQAALTGHLVLSTLHTNDALTTIPRLLNMGIEQSILADSLIGVVSQRLIRKLCIECAQPVSDRLTAMEYEFRKITKEQPRKRAVGCGHCHYTGYSGRVPVVERLEVTSQLRETLINGQHDLNSLKNCLSENYRPMAENGVELIVSGLSTTEEINRVLGLVFWRELAELYGKSINDIQIESLQVTYNRRSSEVLIMTEDDQLYQQINAETNYHFCRAENAQQADKLLHKNSQIFTLVIDIRLSSENGIEWLQSLRRELAWSGLSAIFLTDNEHPDINKILLEHQVHCVEGFPIDCKVLQQTIQQVLHQ